MASTPEMCPRYLIEDASATRDWGLSIKSSDVSNKSRPQNVTRRSPQATSFKCNHISLRTSFLPDESKTFDAAEQVRIDVITGNYFHTVSHDTPLSFEDRSRSRALGYSSHYLRVRKIRGPLVLWKEPSNTHAQNLAPSSHKQLNPGQD